MAKLSTAKFVDYLTQSELVAERDLRRLLDDLREKCGGELPDDPEIAANLLINAGLITRWHADKLFDKKYKGFRLGKYKILTLLGAGEMSSVYLAEHVLMKQRRAIKLLPKSRTCSESHRQLFHLEAQAAASLSHPNIVATYDVDNDGEQHFLVMEYVDGKTLQTLIDESGPLPPHVACNLIAHAAEGLDYAHLRGLIHCDIKPANLMIDGEGRVRVLDFGLALHKSLWLNSLSSTHRNELLTTANYLSPEQVVDSQKVDARTDIYNLGCTFYFLLTGHPPFPAGTFLQKVAQHLKMSPPNVTQNRPDCPDDLAAVLYKMLEKIANLRFRTMREVIEAIDACR